jgi:DNA-binding NarL/FixJ family response regulator
MKDKIRIHLADDHQVMLIDGMSTLLNTVSDFEVIGYSLDGSFYDDVTNSKANILILTLACQKKTE